MKRLLRLASAAFVLMLAPALPLAAQSTLEDQSPNTDLSKASLEDLMNIKVEEVYSASKYMQKVTQAPASVSIVTADDIREYGYQTLADILRSVRGFYVTYDRNYSYVGDRGLLRPGDYNSRILLLVDGHRMNEPIYDLMYIDRAFPIDVDLIQRVEVIRGPSSSIYGTSAFFAVVNVITKSPSAAKGLQFAGDLASFGTEQGRLSYGHTFKNDLQLLVSGSLDGSEGQQRLFFPAFDNPATNNGIAQNADYEQSEQFFTKLSYKDFTVLGVFGSRLKGIPTGSFGAVFDDPRNRTIDNRGFLDASYQHTYRGFDITARVYYDQYDYDGHFIYNESATAAPLLVVNNDLLHAKFWGTELKATRQLFDKHKLTFGSEFRDDFQAYQTNYDINPYTLYVHNDHPDTVEAAYIEDEFSIRSNLVLNAGVRYDHYSTFGGTTNPRLALIYSPLEKTTVKLLYGEAFRGPSDYELYYYDAVQRANPNLTPERIKTTELVLEQYLGGHVRASASLYHYNITNLISAENLPDGAIQFLNLDQVRTNGVEMEFEGKWAHGLEAKANYAFQDARNITDGTPTTNSPRHLAHLNLAGPVVPKTISAGLDVNYVSSRTTLAGNTLDGFVVPGLTVFTTRPNRGFDLSASVYNFSNTRYAFPGSVEHPEDAIYQDGVTFRVKLTYNFGGRERSK